MSGILKNWAKQNKTTATVLSMMGLYYGIQTAQSWLSRPKSLKGKVVVITGGAMGLGRLLAIKCYDEGSKVIIWDVNRNGIKECNQIKPNKNGGTIYAEFVDVCNKSKVDQMTNSVLKEYGAVDILIQNAGVVAGRPLLELTEKDVRRTFDVNVVSQFWTLQSFLPSMIKNKNGHIVSIVSTASFINVSHLTDYAASKAAARSLDQGIKRELIDLGMDEGIVFTGIYPGFMNTGMFAGAKYNDYLGSTLFTGTQMLEQEYVANQTIEAIKYEKREIVLPKMQTISVYLGMLLPHGLQDNMAIYTNNMKEFVGGKNRLSKL